MKRVVKDPDVRRLEIMQAAEFLFETEGYANTSVEAIIKKVGIAKGTFYYYFKAKQDILEALVEQVGFAMEAHFNSVLELENVSAIQKLKKMLRGRAKKKIVSSAVMKIIHKPENRELQEKLNIQGVKIIAPLMLKIFEQGKKEGVFLTVPSLESIQIILAGTLFTLDSGLFQWSSKKRSAFLKSLQHLFELLVGVKSKTFSFIANESK